MALLLVLVTLALLALLIVAVISLSGTETHTAAISQQILQARQLAEMPPGIVMAQLRDGTSGLGFKRTWTSQPGMLRVFGLEKEKDRPAKLERVYKLYSAAKMIEDGNFDAAAELETLADWQKKPATFTDLNAPEIIHEPQKDGSSKPRRVFPILDASVFDIDNDGRVDKEGRGRINGAQIVGGPPPGESVEHPLPMPVRWIYVARDGRFVIPADEQEGAANFDASIISSENPIVGRIAFWTDDESCKVNINTASEAVPWSTPHTTSWTDRNHGTYIPAQNEFQRFPGHPSTTCLSPVLGAFDTRYQWQLPLIQNTGLAIYKDPKFLETYYAMLPRTSHGEKPGESSRGGTTLVTSTQGLPVKRERLFASVDEFFHSSDRKINGFPGAIDDREMHMARFFLTAHSRAPETNLLNRPRISLWPLQAQTGMERGAKDRLLAFCSRVAGMENVFHRASVWQSTTKPGSSQSTTEDLLLEQNQRLLGYLQELTSTGIPGFGKETFLEKYGQADRDQTLLDMFDLLRWGVNPWHARTTGGSNNIDPKKSYYYLPPRANSGLNGNYLAEASAVPVIASKMPQGKALDKPIKTFGRFHTVIEACVVFMATEVDGEVVDGNKQVIDPQVAPVPVRHHSRMPVLPRDRVNNSTGAPGRDNLADNTRKMRAYVILQPYTPAAGMPPMSANIRYVIRGLDLWRADGVALGFPAEAVNRAAAPAGQTGDGGHTTAYTGLQGQFVRPNNATKTVPVSSKTSEDDHFPFFSAEIDVNGKKEFLFSGGDITIDVRTGFGPAEKRGELVQTLKMSFPATTLRVPVLVRNVDAGRPWPGTARMIEETGEVVTGGQMDYWLTPLLDLNTRISYIKGNGGPFPARRPRQKTNPMTGELMWDANGKRVIENVGDNGNGRQIIINKGDVCRSVIVDVQNPSKGDLRLHAVQPEVPADWFMPHPNYHKTNITEAQSLRHPGTAFAGHFGHTHTIPNIASNSGRQHVWQIAGYKFRGNSAQVEKSYGLLRDVPSWQDCQPAVPMRLDGAYNADNRPGDWDNGIGRIEDGPYIRVPDQGGLDTGSGGYFGRAGFAEEKGKSYSPNRQITSAVAFGSLPTGVHGKTEPRPWQTLLFCPNPPSRSTPATEEPRPQDHFGFIAPRDHLLLDLFWMPVVEPYAISEPLSTAGKINLNHQLMPFTHIRRATGLHAALRGTRLTALAPALAWARKASTTGAAAADLNECYKSWSNWLRFDTGYEINADETLRGLQVRFDRGDVFRSASEICDIFLVPKPFEGRTYPAGKPSTSPKYEAMTDWWNGKLTDQKDGFELTGDNLRESPYNQLYPRLTTRSNVYQVHYRAQALKKKRSTAAHVWVEGRDIITAESRGSMILERYIDPNDPTLPDFVGKPFQEGALDDHYRFRVILKKQFSP